jgi:Zn ribbon nucleic-acid-binding protein
MGSVISHGNCPTCGTKDSLYTDFNYKNNEEWSSCNECGYHHSFTWERDEEGKLKRKDENGDFSFSNLVPVEKLIENPFGCYRIELKEGGAQCGTLITEEEKTEFVKHIDSLKNEEKFTKDVEDVFISQFINGQIVKKSILN